MYAPTLRGSVDRLAAVDGFAADVHHPAEHRLADGNADAVAGRVDFQSAIEPFAAGKQHAADESAADMLRDLHNAFAAGKLRGQRFVYPRERAAFKGDVYDRACYPHYSACHLPVASVLLCL